jgi:hypothetical protein
LARLGEPRIGNPWLKSRSALRRWTKVLRALLSFTCTACTACTAIVAQQWCNSGGWRIPFGGLLVELWVKSKGNGLALRLILVYDREAARG